MERREFLKAAALTSVWHLTFVGCAEADMDLQDLTLRGEGFAASPPRPRSLPAWFTEQRVHIHTRLSGAHRQRPNFVDAPQRNLSETKARALVRHFKSGEEPVWLEAPGPKENLASDIIASAHEHRLKIIAYYWHMSDEEFANANPEAICHARNQRRRDGRRGSILDISGPYGERALRDLIALVDAGADAIYLDFAHLPYTGCFGTPLEREFAATGRKGEAEFLKYQDERVLKVLSGWRTALHARRADVVLIVSTGPLAALVNPTASLALGRVGDVAKTEFRVALHPEFSADYRKEMPVGIADDVRMSAGWSLLRDANRAGIAHVWIAGAAARNDATHAAAAVLAYGGIANVDVQEQVLLDANARRLHTQMDPALELGAALGAALAGKQPVTHVGLYYPEAVLRAARGKDTPAEWIDIANGMFALIGNLIHEGVPFGFVTDADLGSITAAQVPYLVCPANVATTSAVRAALDAARARGVKVIINRSAEWRFAAESVSPTGGARTALDAMVGSSPIRLESESRGRYHLTAFAGAGSTVLMAVPRFSDVLAERGGPPSPPCDNCEVVLSVANSITLKGSNVDGQPQKRGASSAGRNVFRIPVTNFMATLT